MITVKEEFLTDDKTQRAIKAGGYEVLALWLAMKRYCAEHLTDGFVPDEDIDALPGAPPKPRRLLPALVECGRRQKDGSRGPGLVNQLEHGWELHKYLEHANSRTQEERRREKAKQRKERWQERRSDDDENAVRNGVLTPFGTASGTESPVRGRAHVPSPPLPSPEEREDPPTPSEPVKSKPNAADVAALVRTGARQERTFGKPPAQRDDVLRLLAAYNQRFGLKHTLRGAYSDDAVCLAEALDLHGEPTCLLVVRNAPHDGMVSGRDDEQKAKHESIKYIFGNENTFARIQRDGAKRESGQANGGTSAMLRRMKEADPEEGSAA